MTFGINYWDEHPDDVPYEHEDEEALTERDRDKHLYTKEELTYGEGAPTRAEAEEDAR